MVGDLPQDKLKELLERAYRLEYFQEAKVFLYDEATDEVVYKQTYDHVPQERFLLENHFKIDGDMLASLTTWTPEKGVPSVGYTGGQ